MTLLEQLHEAAKRIGEAGDRALSHALFDSEERLREEMATMERNLAAARISGWSELGQQCLVVESVLTRINGGPDPSPRGPQPESPPDPVEAVLAVECDEHCAPAGVSCTGYEVLGDFDRKVCIARIRAASRRDTP